MFLRCRGLVVLALVLLVGKVDGGLQTRRQHHPGGSVVGSEPAPRSRDLGAGAGSAHWQRKISNETGGFEDTLDRWDHFGESLCSLGDLNGDGVSDIAVGAPQDADRVGTSSEGIGAVWVLFLDSDGTVASRQKISRAFGDFSGVIELWDLFGGAVAALGDLDGDGICDLAVGAQHDDDGNDRDFGAVWILFLRSDGTVKSHQKISATQGGFTGVLARHDNFGAALAPLGDVDGDGVTDLAVGAWGADTVWLLFLETDGTVKGHTSFVGYAGVGSHLFGRGLANLSDLDGDGDVELAVGAPSDAGGAVSIYSIAANGGFSLMQKIASLQGGFAEEIESNSFFGLSVACANDLDGDGGTDLAVSMSDGGDEVFWELFLNGDGTVASQRKIGAGQGGFAGVIEPDDNFGRAIAALGDLDGDGIGDLVVGASGDDDPDPAVIGSHGPGAAWVLFLDDEGSIESHQKISAAEDGFEGTLDDEDAFGTSIGGMGDLDGDGVGDYVVGAVGDDDGGSRRGAIWFLYMDTDRTVKAHRKISAIEGAFTGVLDENDSFGVSVSSVGDLDGDGIIDLAVGANGDDDGGALVGGRGAVWLLFLNADESVKAHQKISATEGAFTGALDDGDGFGASVAGVGDLDGDGIGDLAVGAPGDDDGGPFQASSGRGAVWLLLLNADGTVKAHQKISATEGAFAGVLAVGDRFGGSVTSVGDVDGNGVVDIAVGTPGASPGADSETGVVWVLLLNPDLSVLASREVRRELSEDVFGDRYGHAVAGLGDLDGDGVGDLAVGMPQQLSGNNSRGSVWIVFLDPTGALARQRRVDGFSAAVRIGDHLGSAVAIGNIDRDGIIDIVTGAPGDDDGGDRHGALWFVGLNGVATVDFERGDDVSRTPLLDGQSLSATNAFGRTVEIVGSGANLGPALFDSRPSGPNASSPDPDLLVDRGHTLVLQDSLQPSQAAAGVFDDPGDDEDGGVLTFTFHGPVGPVSIDLIDIDLGQAQVSTVTLFDVAQRTRVYTIPPGWTEDLVLDGPPGWRTLELGTLELQAGFAAPATATQDPGFAACAVVRIDVQLGGSGAVDSLRWNPRPGQ